MVMKAKILFLALGLLVVVSARSQQRLQPIPVDSKWLSNKEVAFTYDGSYTDPECFKLTLGKKLTRTEGFQAPEKYLILTILSQDLLDTSCRLRVFGNHIEIAATTCCYR